MPNFAQPTLCVLCVVLALASGAAALRAATWQYRASLFVASALFVVGVFYFRASRLAYDRLATALVMPTGLVWLGLIVIIFLAAKHKHWRQTWLLVACWLLLTVAGNSWTSYALFAYLEHDYRAIDPLVEVSSDEPLDVIVALGGPTKRSPAGQVQVTAHGDRVLLAARLFHHGACRQLLATGQAIKDVGDERSDPADDTAIIWRDLAIPNEAIQLIGGRNTREEIFELAQAAEEHGWQRIGLVTSAFHMARAERLARNAGLEVVPLPARFLSDAPNIHLLSPVPSGDCLAETALSAKELLAGLVGR